MNSSHKPSTSDLARIGRLDYFFRFANDDSLDEEANLYRSLR